jgi:hypothetical protein
MPEVAAKLTKLWLVKWLLKEERLPLVFLLHSLSNNSLNNTFSCVVNITFTATAERVKKKEKHLYVTWE